MRILILTIFLSIMSSPLLADEIYLKNNLKILGKIISQTQDSLTVHIGIGKIKVNKQDIQSIKRSSLETTNKPWPKAVEQEAWMNEQLYQLIESFNNTLSKKQTLILSRWRNLIEERQKTFVANPQVRAQNFQNINQHKQLTKAEDLYKLYQSNPEKFTPPPAQQTIPLQKIGNTLLVPTTLNNKVKAKLILDTGAELVVLSPKMASKLRLKRTSYQVPITLANGSISSAYISILESLKVGSVTMHNIPVLILKQDHQEADGLLGMNFLNRFQISLENNILKLSPLS